MGNTVLVRTKLTDEEWRSFKSLAALVGEAVSELAADAIREKDASLRALLKGAKP